MFPRFYFIGDDDLLEILGQSTNPTVIQSHLKKLFAGIHSVQFDNNNQNIVAMRSLDGEVVPLKRKVQITADVEVRCCQISTSTPTGHLTIVAFQQFIKNDGRNYSNFQFFQIFFKFHLNPLQLTSQI